MVMHTANIVRSVGDPGRDATLDNAQGPKGGKNKHSGGEHHRPAGGIDTLVGRGLRVCGDIACSGTMCVQGDVDGDVRCDGHPGAALIVDSGGSVHGNVRVANLVVRGTVEGSVEATGSIELHETARVSGNISFRVLSIDPGAVVVGQLAPRPVDESEFVPDASVGAPFLSASGRAGAKFRALTPIVAGAIVLVVAGLYFRPGGLTSPPATETSAQSERRVPDVGPEYKPVAPSLSPLATASSPSIDNAAPQVDARPAAVPESEALPTLLTDTRLPEAEFLTVRGANPARPANVFLLVSDQPTVLHRRKRGETGDGTRVHIAEGKISVSIAPDDLIRVAKGGDVTIYFQGQKISGGQIQERWVSFVRR